MNFLRLPLLLLLCLPLCLAQLSEKQKIADFEHLAALYAKNYGPYEWKREVEKFDLLNIGPWLDRVRATKDDLDFYEVMVEYVASLNDAHAGYTVPSTFVAQLHFLVDIYDGKYLVDSINRTRLPATEFPFQTGYELVSIEGKTPDELVQSFTKYSASANPRSTRRLTAELLTFRPQQIMPHAIDVGDIAVVVMRRLDGGLETYRIPWAKSGLPLTVAGPVPTLDSSADGNAPEPADYMRLLADLRRVKLPDKAVLNFGSRTPVFRLPDGFDRRLGGAVTDFFYAGTFRVGRFRIGFIRIPSFLPQNFDVAVQQFAREIAFFQANTDGLIIDEMRNPGGSVTFVNTLLQYLIPYRFQTIGFELRATSNWLLQVSSAFESARAQGAPQYVIDSLRLLLEQVQMANSENRGRTGPLPLDDVTLERYPAADEQGRILAYTKPLMVLTDEMSASGADMFPASIQDNKRGIIFGMRTMGAGGNVVTYRAGVLSEGFCSLTQSLMNRGRDIVTPEYPPAPYVENIGVRPDIEADYMTKENLITGGKPFVDAFVSAMVEHIRRSN